MAQTLQDETDLVSKGLLIPGHTLGFLAQHLHSRASVPLRHAPEHGIRKLLLEYLRDMLMAIRNGITMPTFDQQMPSGIGDFYDPLHRFAVQPLYRNFIKGEYTITPTEPDLLPGMHALYRLVLSRPSTN